MMQFGVVVKVEAKSWLLITTLLGRAVGITDLLQEMAEPKKVNIKRE
jgi:hypothetical protein